MANLTGTFQSDLYDAIVWTDIYQIKRMVDLNPPPLDFGCRQFLNDPYRLVITQLICQLASVEKHAYKLTQVGRPVCMY